MFKYQIYFRNFWKWKEHAKRFYKFLKDDLQGEAVEINAAYPVELPTDTLTNLKFAADGEHDELSNLYPSFADVADEEGFPEVAAAFRMIAKAETAHYNRFMKLAKNIEEGKVFKKRWSSTLEMWKLWIYLGRCRSSIKMSCMLTSTSLLWSFQRNLLKNRFIHA